MPRSNTTRPRNTPKKKILLAKNWLEHEKEKFSIISYFSYYELRAWFRINCKRLFLSHPEKHSML